MLPEGWKQRPLGEIAQVTSGGTPDRSVSGYWSGDIPWVTTGEVQFNTINDTAEKITGEGLANSSAKLFPAGTLLIAMYGQGKTRGQVAKLGVAACTNQACAALLLKRNHDADFYFHVLSHQYEALRTLGNAGTQKNLNAGIIKQIPVPVPPVAEQARIGAALRAWDAAITTTEHLLTNSVKQRQALVRRLLAHPHHTDAKQLGWTFVDFDDVFERVTRKNTTGNTNVLTISGARGLVNQRDYFNKSVASDNLTRYTLLHQGEFAYNKSYSSSYPMGAIKPLLRYAQGVVSSLYLCFRFRGDIEADADFFCHYFEAGMLNEGLASIAQEGARNHGLLNVGVADFFKLRLHIPGIDAQRRIATVLNMAKREERLIETQIAKLRDEKRALMQQLLTGKRRLRVPAAAAEAEPA